MLLRGSAIKCGLQGVSSHFVLYFHFVILEKTSTAGLPQGPWLFCFFSIWLWAELYLSTLKVNVVWSQHQPLWVVVVVLLWGSFEHVCKCFSCLRAAEQYLFKMHRKYTAAIFKELFYSQIFLICIKIKYFTLWFENKALDPPHSDWALNDA